MYDLNLSVPNISTTKYSIDEKFQLLKNYLYELNETLSYVLSNLEYSNFSQPVKTSLEGVNENNISINNLKAESQERFAELKNKILVTANEILQNCSTEIEKNEEEILLKAQSDFVAKSEFGEYKNATNASINENYERIELNTNSIESTVGELEAYKSDTNSNFTLQAEAIVSQVEKLFTKSSEFEEFTDSVSSQITQTATSISDVFSEQISKANEDISTLGGSVSELIYSLDAYIKRGELEEGIYGIEIGRSDSNIKARFTNNKLSFMQGEIEVAYISGNSLYITRSEITDYIKLGNSGQGYFTFDVTENGLEVKWSNGS